MLRSNLYRLTATALAFSWILLIHSPSNCWADDLEILLNADDYQIGSQIETVQFYENGVNQWMTFGLYDTGASVVTVSYLDQFIFSEVGYPTIPVKVPNGATAQGIDGYLTGDVSEPGTVSAGGLSALSWDDIFNLELIGGDIAEVPGVQLFLGANPGSTELPTITGTPIHNAPIGNTGKAARIDMQTYQLPIDENLVISLPDIHFVEPHSTDAELHPSSTSITPTPVRIPLQLLGGNNYLTEGNDTTASPNPVQNSVTLTQGTNLPVPGNTFLFDTGAQVSIIDQTLAETLGLTQQEPIDTTQVQGAAGQPFTVSCYLLDSLELPRDDNGDGVKDGTLKLSQVPIYAMDLSAFGLDGILGMNLWNSVEQMLYDPSNPNDAYLSLTFSENVIGQLTADQIEDLNALSTGLDLLIDSDLYALINSGLIDLAESDLYELIGGDLFDLFGGDLFDPTLNILLHNLTTLHFPFGAHAVPEPSAWILLVTGIAGFLFHRLRKEFRHHRH